MTAAFSRDMGSFGRSSLAHYAISAELVKMLSGVTPSEIGILSSIILGSQMVSQSLILNGAEKAGM